LFDDLMKLTDIWFASRREMVELLITGLLPAS